MSNQYHRVYLGTISHVKRLIIFQVIAYNKCNCKFSSSCYTVQNQVLLRRTKKILVSMIKKYEITKAYLRRISKIFCCFSFIIVKRIWRFVTQNYLILSSIVSPIDNHTGYGFGLSWFSRLLLIKSICEFYVCSHEYSFPSRIFKKRIKLTAMHLF